MVCLNLMYQIAVEDWVRPRAVDNSPDCLVSYQI